MANNYSDIPFNDVLAGRAFQKEQEAAGNVAAAQQVKGAMAQAQGPESVTRFFEKEKQKSRRVAAMDDARAQTDTMKQAMKMQAENFDTGMRDQRRLAALDKDANQRLIAEEKKFKLDSAGRKFMSERQMADWYATRAQTEEDWAGYQQRVGQLHERKIQMLQASYKRIEQAETQMYQLGAQRLDQQTKEYLARKKSDLQKQMQKAQAQAANSAAMVGAFATVGMVAGSFFGPAGTVAGGAIGAAAGKGIADQTTKE